MIRMMITADLHLKTDQTQRLEVLRWICDRANRENASALLVAGDLFDSEQDAVDLFSDVRDILEKSLSGDCSVVMVAGNHDENLAKLSWPPSFRVLAPFENFLIQQGSTQITIHGLPYLRGQTLDSPADKFELDDQGPNILLGHASYFSDQHRYLVDKIEQQGEENAFPVYEEDLAGLGFERVFLGHWHGYQELGDDPRVNYIGSPLPNNREDTGKKSVLVAELQGSVLTYTPETIETPPGWFNRELSMVMVPGEEDGFIDRLDERCPDADPGCRLHLGVEGFTRQSGQEMRRRVDGWIDDHEDEYDSIQLDTFDVTESDAFDSPLASRILDALKATDPSEAIELDSVIQSDEPDLVWDRARDMVHDQSDGLKRRARRMLLEAVYQELGGS